MFENILGNEKIQNSLKTAIKNKKYSHSYIFEGIEGIGKSLIAKEFSKNILCLDDKKKCINEENDSCESCIKFSTYNHPDYMFIEPNGTSIKIEQIRDLQKKIQEKPIISNDKIYIINNAEMMTKEAQNCLLKTLEEPPGYAVIILIAKNISQLLITIKSRCTILNFNKLTNEELLMYVKNNCQNINCSEELLNISEGSIGKFLRLKDMQEDYFLIQKNILELDKINQIDFYKISNKLIELKENIYEILEYMNVVILEKAKENSRYANCIEIVEEAKRKLKQNMNFDMCIDNMLFRMWEEIN